MSNIKKINIVLILLILLFLSILLSLKIGSVHISFNTIIKSFFDVNESMEKNIIFDIRFPRIIMAICVGGALSLSGLILQTLLRNPLVEPYTLGISGGAALGVCLGIYFKLNLIFPFAISACGFGGALTTILFLYRASRNKSILNMREVLLIGVMISFISSSLIMLIMAISGIEDLQGIIFWTMGSLTETNPQIIKLLTLSSLLGLIVSYFYCFDLNALLVGEEEASYLGIDVEKSKKGLLVIASVLTGICVSFAGIIGFVGLVVPHFIKLILGPDHRINLIACFMAGSVFLVICDTVARTIISPLELPVGVITGILGGSIFIYALIKANYRTD